MAVANTDLYLRSTANKAASAASTDLYLRTVAAKENITLDMGVNTITTSAPSATRKGGIPQVVWVESGTNATHDLTFWSTTSGSVTSSTEQSMSGSRSLGLDTGDPFTAPQTYSPNVMDDAGRRISFWFFFAANFTATTIILRVPNSSASSVFNLSINSANRLVLSPSGASAVTGTTVMAAGAWYRISLCYVVTSVTDWSAKAYVNGRLEASASSTGTLTRSGANRISPYLGGSATNVKAWFSDFYIDDGSDLSDPGDIRITAKRPNDNGANNTFDTTTSTSNSSYGTGSSVYVNERPLATTGARRHNGTGAAYENYTIENASTGDADITGKTIKGRLSWVHGSGVITDTIYDDGTAVVPDSVFTSSAAIRYVVTTSNTYPSSSAAVGMGRPTGNATDAILNEAGMLIAYIDTQALLPDNNTITISASTAMSSGSAGKLAGTNTLTITAPEETQSQTTNITAGTNTITVTASEQSQSQVTGIAAGTNTMAVTAPEQSQSEFVTLIFGTTNITVTASEQSQSQVTGIAAGTNTMAVTAPEQSQTQTTNVASDTNILTVSAIEETQSQTTGIIAGANLITLTSPKESQSQPTSIISETNAVTITASKESQSESVTLTIIENAIDYIAPFCTVQTTINCITNAAIVIVTATNSFIKYGLNVSAPSIILSAPIADALYDNVVAPQIIAVSAPEVTQEQGIPVAIASIDSSAPSATQTSIITVSTDPTVITSIAHTIAMHLVIPVGITTITTTAPKESQSESATIVIDNNTTSVTASEQSQTQATRIAPGTNTVTITASEETQSQATDVTAATNTVTITASEETQSQTTNIVADVNTLTVTASKESQSPTTRITADTNTVTITASEESQAESVTLIFDANTINVVPNEIIIRFVISIATNAIRTTANAVTIDVSAAEAEVESNLLSVGANETTVLTSGSLSLNTNDITITAAEETQSWVASLAVSTNTITATAPELSRPVILTVEVNSLTGIAPKTTEILATVIQPGILQVDIFAPKNTGAATIPSEKTIRVQTWVVKTENFTWRVSRFSKSR